MGKAKRFNSYDGEVAEKRKVIQSYGQARQNLSGIGSSFRGSPLEPPIARTSASSATGTGTGTFLTVSLSADQTTNIAATNHIEFDTKDEDGGIVLQTGAGQADGIFELESGKKYQLSAHLRPEFSGATGQLVIAWYDITNTAEIGSRAIYESQTHASHNANQPVAEAIVTPSTNITVEVRIIAVTALTALANEYCVANLFEIALGGSVSGSGGGGGSGVTFPITPTINDHGNVGTTTEDLDLSAATGHVHKITLTGNPTLTFSNPPSSGTQMEFEIEFVQDATGGRTVTWPASVAETVSISVTASATTIITVRTNDGGTTYHAIPALRGSISLAGGGFATTTLNNLASVAINADLDPASGGTYNLGDGTNDWASIFVDNVRLQTGGAGVAGSGQIYRDATGVIFNTPTATKFFWDFNDVNKFDMSATSFTAPNIILTNTLTINDSTTSNPSIGQFSRSGSDVYVQTTSGIKNLDNISSTTDATQQLDNLASVAINTSLISDTDSTDDLGSGAIAWRDLFIDEIRFPNVSTATAGGHNIAVEALTPNTMVMNVPTNEDWAVIENGDDTNPYLWVDTSANTVRLGAATLFRIDGTGGGSLFSISKTSTTPASFACSNGYDFTLGSVAFSAGASMTALGGDFDFNANNLLDVNNVTSTSSGNITGFAQIDISDQIRRTASPTATFIQFLSTGITINASGAGDDINILAADNILIDGGTAVFIGPNLNEISVQADTVAIGAAGTDTLTINARILADLVIDNGSKIKSNDATEIGFQVTNEAITVGAGGTLQIPRISGASSTATQADTDFGNQPGCMGIYTNSTTNVHVLVIRQTDGNWAGVILADNTLT